MEQNGSAVKGNIMRIIFGKPSLLNPGFIVVIRNTNRDTTLKPEQFRQTTATSASMAAFIRENKASV